MSNWFRGSGWAGVTLILSCAMIWMAQGAPASPLTNGIQTFDATWELVRRTHYDTNFGGVDWEKVRRELRPRASEATTSGELQGIIGEMLDRLGLSHLSVIPASPRTRGKPQKKESSGSLGLEVRWIDQRLVVTGALPPSDAYKKGVRPGWIIESIDGEDFTRWENAGRVARVEAWAEAVQALTGQAGTMAEVAFLDANDRRVKLGLKHGKETGEPAQLGNLPVFYTQFEAAEARRGKVKIGVIRFNVWMIPIAKQFEAAIETYRSHDGIVIDLRGNRGGMVGLVMGVAGHFLKEPLLLGTMKTRETNLEFRANPRLVNAKGKRVVPFMGALAILIDECSLSASEMFSAGMQAIGRGRVFGENSGGMALPSTTHRLPNGDVLIHPMGDFVSSDGSRLEGRGVVPDMAVPLKRADLLNGMDPAMEAALNWIAQETGKSQKGN